MRRGRETVALLGAAVAALVLVAAAVTAQEDRTRGVLLGTVRLLEGTRPRADASRVVVYLEGVPGGVPSSARVTRSIRQRERRFHPDFLVVPVGSTVEFPNQDPIFHNVFSLSRTKRFDLGMYRTGSTRAVTFDREGVVDVYCNIHPEMVAKILVIDSMHYAVTDREGRYRIDGIRGGTYGIVGWQAYGERYRGRVAIRAGATTRRDFDLSAGRASPERHLRIDGTPYGRYR